MVVVAPFCEVVCEFEARGVAGGVFEVDHDELFVGVGGKEEGGFGGGEEAEDVAVLGLWEGLVFFVLMEDEKDGKTMIRSNGERRG